MQRDLVISREEVYKRHDLAPSEPLRELVGRWRRTSILDTYPVYTLGVYNKAKAYVLLSYKVLWVPVLSIAAFEHPLIYSF